MAATKHAPGPVAGASRFGVDELAAHGPLRALSASLLQLTKLAQKAQPHTMLHDALRTMRELVPFDTAWWGEVSGGHAKAAPRNWMHGSLGLSKGFAREWNQLSTADDFAQQSIERLGTVLLDNGPLAPGAVSPEIEAFSKKHGLFHCMAITVEMPDSGLLFFVSVYRLPSTAPFSAQDAVLFGEFVSHLQTHWRSALERLRKPVANRPLDSYALADLDGTLLFMGLGVGMALDAAHPGWSGTTLPGPLQEALRQKLPRTIALGKAGRLRLEPCGALVAITMASRHHDSPLAPRELSAAMLYVRGNSSKEIASTLGLTPATVRTYLRNTYALLGVRNKMELAAALHSA